MTQVSLKQGIKQFKQKGEKLFPKELPQLHLNSTFRPLTAGELRNKDKDEELELLILLKEKRDGRIKGQACADSRKQRSGSYKD